MSKFLNKYVRKFHRWVAVPTALMIIFLAFARSTPYRATAQRLQQPLMLGMANTGVYLFLLPWWTKWRRRERRK